MATQNPQTITGRTSRSAETESSTGSSRLIEALMPLFDKILAGKADQQAFTNLFATRQQEESESKTEAEVGRLGASSFEFGPFAQFISPQGRSTRVIRGGFAPGSTGASIQDLIKQLAGSFGRGRGNLPTRESLLGPRRGDINDVINQALQGESNRFAGLGRSVSGSVPTQNRAVLEGTRAREINRAGGDVDTLLAQLGINQQGFDIQSLVALMNILGQL